MAYFQHVRTRTDGPATHVGGVSAVAVHAGAGGVRVLTANGSQGGLLARDPGAALSQAGQADHGPLGGRPSAAHLEVVTLGGREALLSHGAGAGIRGYWLDGPGPFADPFALPVGSATILALEAMAIGGGRDLLVTSSIGSPGVTARVRGADGTLGAPVRIDAGGPEGGMDVLAIAQVAGAGGAGGLALVLSAATGALTGYVVGPDGAMAATATLDAEGGLWVSAPNLLAVVRSGGRDLVLVGAAGTGSITVVEVDAAGAFRVLDQVNDDLARRFHRIAVLEVATIGDRAFVIAGGADDGLSLMTLLPSGRLLHLETIADDAAMALGNVAGLAARTSGGAIDLFAASGGESGLTHLRVDPGPLAPILRAGPGGGALTGDGRGDLLLGGAGDDRLDGGAGADIVIDGGGSDQLRGGAGADVFILERDGALDRIMDFEAGLDRLDLSAWGRIYGHDQLTFAALAGGIEIRHGAERLQILSSTGGAIPAARLADADLVDLWHVGPVVVPAPPPDPPPGDPPPQPDGAATILGTTGADTLSGRGGDDVIVGRGGPDEMSGGAGSDRLLGEDRDGAYDGVAAQVYRLYRATLDREPDVAGHLGWADLLRSGRTTAERVAGGFVDSAEFRSRYGATSDDAFVRLLYDNVLDRPADAGGLAGWTGALARGASRTSVVLGFSDSAEFADATEAPALAYSRAGHQALWTDDVCRLYRATLDREPDAGGLEGWTAALASGQAFGSVVAGFTGSAEFRSRHGATSDDAFVRLLYDNVLDRPADAGGLAGWTGALARGALSRSQVVEGFSQSAEFRASSEAAVRAAMRAIGPDDRLAGGAGSNVLFGGLGADVFVFNHAEGGSHVVAGLEPWDWIELEGFGLDSAAARALMVQSGDDVVLDHMGLRVTFADTRLTEIGDDMILV